MIVVDASPLIIFAAAGHFHLLKELIGTIMIPPGVRREVVVRGKGRPGAAEVSAAIREGSVIVAAVHNPALLAGLPAGLSRADRECIALAKENDWPLYIDDERAYIAARHNGVKVFRTLALLKQAKVIGRVGAAGPIARSLRNGGLRVDAQTFTTWLREIGEPE